MVEINGSRLVDKLGFFVAGFNGDNGNTEALVMGIAFTD